MSLLTSCSVSGGVQDKDGCRPGQPSLVPDWEVGGSATGRGLELGDLWGPFQSKSFYDSMISVIISSKLLNH